MGDGGTGGVGGLEKDGVVFARFSEGMAKQPATFPGEFPVLKAFKVGVGGDVPAMGCCVV